MLALEFYLLALIITFLVLIDEAFVDGREEWFVFCDSFTCVLAQRRHAIVHIRDLLTLNIALVWSV